ncbi:alpha-mannosidase 2-like isoform X1 [Myxocyprinus asiaticus]|uniref:alpha-mannosidase 2-like isoform X1 n=1 Tax=Myxocyprinus asiaticus TaxID=70543 RepID=UPI0022231574|nr:alpha-mannosidase 2-like isoform X1 [Myxocyprinus asiaticus]
MKLSRQFTVFGSAIFCVVVFSLYLMLDHIDHSKNPNGERIQNGQLGILQDKIDHLERLLAQNNEIIANIRDSVINLRESVKEGKVFPEGNISQGISELLTPAPALLPIDSEDCQFAAWTYSKSADGVQMLDVYDLLSFNNPDGGVWKQGFDISYEENEWDNEPLQVFVVPHSHNDPGWLKTFDDYYRDQTQHILNNMVVKLSEDGRRKMIWSEISYFSKWWESIDEQKRDAVKRLVDRGQLEVATGGWVMPDEANTHYFALIDQLFEGHQWLERNLGVKPKTGWAVDPFGHTPTQAYLLRQAGLSNMLIQRVHYSVKKHFASQKTLEFFWRQNWDQDSSSDILCHMMPFYSYDVPHTCGPDPKICCQFDFKRLPGGRVSCPWRIPPQAITETNVEERVQVLLDQYRKKSKLFRTKVLLAPLGDDFRYTEAVEWDQQFENYQKLFDYMNSHPELHIKAQFGTISDYFETLRKSTGMDAVDMNVGELALPVLSGDFFTYADRDDHYWSGYFTSRPFYKRLDRLLESHLRAAEILYSLTLADIQRFGKPSDYPAVDNYKLLTEARRNLGLFQHHDAITGTGKDWVVADYGTRLFHSILNVKRVIVSSAHWLVLKDKQTYSHDASNHFLQMDDVQPAQDALPRKTVLEVRDKPRLVVVYNPTEQARTSMVTVYVNTLHVRVLNALGHVVHAQISAVWNDATHPATDVFQLSFVAHAAPLGLSVYQLMEGMEPRTETAKYTFLMEDKHIAVSGLDHFRLSYQDDDAPLQIENPHLKLTVSAATGLLETMRLEEDGSEHQVRVEFVWYGTTSNKDKSGAYLFLPDKEATSYSPSQPAVIRVTKGPLFSEVTTTFTHITHTLRLYSIQGVEGQSVEIYNTVDIRGEFNREIAMRITSDLDSEDRFFTDLNGYQVQPRKTMAKLPLQANFYPMTSMAYLQDSSARLSLLTAQSLGAASLKSGQLEVIMDRRLNQDDNRGLGQGVLDNKITANSFRLLLEKRSSVEEGQKEENAPYSYPSMLSHMSFMYLNHPLISMATSLDSATLSLTPYNPLSTSFPCDIHLVNLRAIQSKEEGGGPSEQAALILHRKGFDCGFSNRNTGLLCTTTRGKIHLERLLTDLNVRSITPASLSLMHTHNSESDQQVISLKPMEIRTYRLQLS